MTTIYLLWYDPVDPDCGWARILVSISLSREGAEGTRARLQREVDPYKGCYDDQLYIEERSAGL
jgi:hypothetical protein